MQRVEDVSLQTIRKQVPQAAEAFIIEICEVAS
jgi:hypothetical protein